MHSETIKNDFILLQSRPRWLPIDQLRHS